MNLRALLASCLPILTAASSAIIAKAGTPEASVPPSAEARFAVELFGKMRQEAGNLAFSPFSISTALGVILAGAKGETAEQIGKVLHRPADDPIAQAALAKEFAEVVGAAGEKREDILRSANAIFGQIGEEFDPRYVEMARTKYQALIEPLDFAKHAEPSRARINGWVAEQTAGKIRDLLSADAVTAETSFVLVNAIYFKGAWERPFFPSSTSPAPFRLQDGKKVQTPTMHQLGSYGWTEQDGVQVLSLPYRGRLRSMILILPKKVDGLPAVEADLSAERVDSWRANMKVETVSVALPKFRTTSAIELADTLSSLGMPRAFTREADFTGIRPSGGVRISAVVHKAFVDVNEEGTEAAAATGIAVAAASARVDPPKSFVADHPFLFLIRDERSGAWLFLGRVADPRP